MLRYAARAVPWPRVLLAAGLTLVLMELVRQWPLSTWALEAAAVGLLAGATGWCLDEPSAAVVDTAPRSLAWRTGARMSALVLLAGVWVVAVARVWDSVLGHGWEVGLQGCAAMAGAAGWTTWRRARGDATPGSRLAVGVIPLSLGWALVDPLDRHLPVFPYVAADGDAWASSLLLWSVLGASSAVVLVAAVADSPWWRIRGNPAQPR